MLLVHSVNDIRIGILFPDGHDNLHVGHVNALRTEIQLFFGQIGRAVVRPDIPFQVILRRLFEPGQRDRINIVFGIINAILRFAVLRTRSPLGIPTHAHRFDTGPPCHTCHFHRLVEHVATHDLDFRTLAVGRKLHLAAERRLPVPAARIAACVIFGLGSKPVNFDRHPRTGQGNGLFGSRRRVFRPADADLGLCRFIIIFHLDIGHHIGHGHHPYLRRRHGTSPVPAEQLAYLLACGQQQRQQKQRHYAFHLLHTLRLFTRFRAAKLSFSSPSVNIIIKNRTATEKMHGHRQTKAVRETHVSRTAESYRKEPEGYFLTSVSQ